jgi:hypothetical protein
MTIQRMFLRRDRRSWNNDHDCARRAGPLKRSWKATRRRLIRWLPICWKRLCDWGCGGNPLPARPDSRVATTLNEIALGSEVCVEIREQLIPVREEVKGACEILGLDPLYVANEGKLVAIVSAELTEPLLETMRANPFGREACIIGEVKSEPRGIVAMVTGFGGTRIVDMLAGEQLPRIC